MIAISNAAADTNNFSALTAFFAVMYVRGVKADYLREGVVPGCLWLAINVLIDLPLFLAGGPMKMTLGQYTADIGLTYLVIPAVTIGLGCQQVLISRRAIGVRE